MRKGDSRNRAAALDLECSSRVFRRSGSRGSYLRCSQSDSNGSVWMNASNRPASSLVRSYRQSIYISWFTCK